MYLRQHSFYNPSWILSQSQSMLRRLAGPLRCCLWSITAFGFVAQIDAEQHNKTPAQEGLSKRPNNVVKSSSHIEPLPDDKESVALSIPLADVNAIENSWMQFDDPSHDGWRTEALTGLILERLKIITKILKNTEPVSPKNLDNLVEGKFTTPWLVPPNLQTSFSSPDFEVLQMGDQVQVAPTLFSGQAGLAKALQTLRTSLSDAQNIRVKFKIFRISVKGTHINARAYLELSGSLREGFIEQHATWEMVWRQPAPDSEPWLDSIVVLDWEQTRYKSASQTLFKDKTAATLEKNPSYQRQLLRGYGYWMLGVPYTRYQITEMMGHPGLAVVDVNGDGLDDLYVCQEQGLPNLLFIQQPDGTALNEATVWGLDWLQACRNAVFADFDNDGDQDIAVCFLGGVAIASNEGSPPFKIRQVIPTGDDMVALAAADYDNDGDVDLYATSYYADKSLSERQAAGLPAADAAFVYHDANTGGQNVLLRNDLEHRLFSDVTEQTGLTQNNFRFSFAASWEDFDNDGDQDLYVANDYGRDNFYRNDGNSFTDIAEKVGAEDSASGMSVSWGDYNRDEEMDLYISNMWSSAGNRIAFQPEFKQDAPTDVKQRLQRFARGNTLLKNQSGKRFTDVSKQAGVEMGRWAWGSQFADINNDGWKDILIANGFITKQGDSGDL